ncbi:RteC domain-containing protein [Galbibacter sp. EGI 63066]|uniref:RteC domain-containing protein n=1 Tax=Galbibacter sp. EGI 63066 TaxID=2993559 RepID=UPI002248D627|nr:RteC domain-containing protein [Galbibacter sp. EGI 63066]MCX2680967.1 RteC domain-containing protein [Galbibacter sp. EGI 63066]
MITFTNTLYEQASEELLHVRETESNTLKQAEKAYLVMHTALQKLKDYILRHTYKDTGEEVRFFKEIKPRFLKKLIYFSEVFRVESSLPAGNNKRRKNHYREAMENIVDFFERNREFYLYYRLGKTELDEKLFRSGKEVNFPYTETYFWNADPRFCCHCCHKVAMFQAYEKLQDYLLEAAANEEQQAPLFQQADITWTAPKVWLIELIYALIATGVFNRGNASIREVSSLAGTMFQKDLGEYYRVFQEIRIRKKNRTVFMDLLKERLVRYMNDTDKRRRN